MSPRIWRTGLQIVTAYAVVFLLAWYMHYRSNIHRQAPMYVGQFLNTSATRWELEDIYPFFSSDLRERRSGEMWRKMLGCYGQLGALKSHSPPGTSDDGLFGRAAYLTDGHFENGDATVFLWLDKSWGKIVVDEIYISSPESTGLGDHSWCRTGPSRKRTRTDGNS